MSEPAGSGAGAARLWLKDFSPLDRLLLATSAFLFAFTAYYASIKNINWDEFFFLYNIHAVARGEIIQPMQTFYIWLFWWLPGLGGDEISQVMAARGVFILLLGLSMYLLYRISRHFFSRTAGLFAVAISLSMTNVINHGFTFRYDTLSLALIFLALFLLLQGDMRRWLGAAVATALAMLVTVKTVFFLPTLIAFALIAAAAEGWSRRVLIRGAVAAGAAVLVFGGLFFLHLSLLGLGAAGGTAETASLLSDAGGRMLGAGVLAPRLPTLLLSLAQNPAQWLVILAGVLMALLALIKKQQRGRAIAVVALALPLFTPIIYRNAFAYFYVMILPPAAIATGYFVETLRARAERPSGASGGDSARLLLLTPLIIALVMGGSYYSSRLFDQRISQRETIALVHALFPEPVPYIDRNAMVASFPKAGLFMSTWGMKIYRAEGRPVMRALLETEAPVLLLANTILLDLNGGGGADIVEQRRLLLGEDFDVLRDNFIHFWGIVYLAGKRFEFDGSGTQSFEILVPGPYTLEAEGEVIIDKTRLVPGGVVVLERGPHAITADAGLPRAVLVYGDNPKRPETKRNPQLIYTGL